MTEVPEHLLRRAKERRSAMTGESATAEGAPATDATSKEVEAAAAATPAPAGGGGAAPAVPAAPTPPPFTGPPPAPPRKQRVPVWAGAALAVLPFWAILYGGAFGERGSAEPEGIMAIGAQVYVAQGCGGCHGSNGEGSGQFPALTSSHETFPEFADHVEWVRTGSAPFRGQQYGNSGRTATGAMPGFPDITDEEVIAVVCHERVTIAGAEPPPECEETADPDAGGGGSGGGGEGDTDAASDSH